MDSLEQRAIVVGGGLVGSLQALLLARVGYRVILADAAVKQSSVSHGVSQVDCGLSVRTVAMSCRSQQLLQSAGLWKVDMGCPIHKVMVNDKGHFGSVCFDRRDYSVPALGYVVPNVRLESHLNSVIESTPGIEVLRPATVELASVSGDYAEVVIDTIHGKRREVVGLVVAADGTHSAMRSQLGIEVESTDYQQHALVANLTCQRPHNQVAYERFTKSGPLAVLPLDKNAVAVVCTLDSSDVDKLQNSSDEALLHELQQRFGGRLGRFRQIGRRAVFPLSLVRAKRQVKGCGVLVGNASVTLHPVAGQGLNLALRDVFELAARLSDGQNNHTNGPGHGEAVGLNSEKPVADALKAFAAVRRRDQNLVVRQTDMLARWFRGHHGPLSLPLDAARASSMLLLDAVPVLRNRFGRRSAGLDIPLSNLPQYPQSRY